jgi:mRNA interferase RelE/StbE
MYEIEFSTKAAKVYFKLSSDTKNLIDVKLGLLAKNPYAKNNNVKPLKDMKGCYRLRIGDWRIIYEIANQTLKIYVIMIGQRKEIYRGI